MTNSVQVCIKCVLSGEVMNKHSDNLNGGYQLWHFKELLVSL